MNNPINLQMKKNLINDGYYELISLPTIIVDPNSPVRKTGIHEYVSVLLNEQTEDFKILYLKTIRATCRYKELSVEETKNILPKDHPVLETIEKLISFKNLNQDLSTHLSGKGFKI